MGEFRMRISTSSRSLSCTTCAWLGGESSEHSFHFLVRNQNFNSFDFYLNDLMEATNDKCRTAEGRKLRLVITGKIINSVCKLQSNQKHLSFSIFICSSREREKSTTSSERYSHTSGYNV